MSTSSIFPFLSFPLTPFSDDKSWSGFGTTDKKSLEQLDQLTRLAAEKVGLHSRRKFMSAAFRSAPGICAASNGKRIDVKFHPALLVKKYHLPNSLQLNGPQDPKLNSKYINKFEGWLRNRFNIPHNKVEFISLGGLWGLRRTTYISNTHSIAAFLAFLQEKPEMRERVLKFMLTRELLFVKKDRESPILNFWSTITPSCYSKILRIGEMRTPWEVINTSFRSFLLFSVCLVFISVFSMFLVESIVSFATFKVLESQLLSLFPLAGVIYVIQALYDLIMVVYRVKARERLVCQEAIKITKDPEAAKIFYRALNNSTWEDSCCLIKWIFRPIDRYFNQLSENHIDQLASKSIKQLN